MKQMRNGICLILALAVIAGCSQVKTAQSPEAEFKQVRNQFLSENSYSFYGTTRALTGNTVDASPVNFFGHKQGSDMVLNVNIADPDQKHSKNMSLLSQGRNLYVKQSNQQEWEPVGDDHVGLIQEFANWNPITTFLQMDDMRAMVLPVRDRVQTDNIQAMRVVLNSDKLKELLARQLKDQASSRVQSVHLPKQKLAWQLSARDWRTNSSGAHIQAGQSHRDIDELLNNMVLDAEYTLYYDKTSKLPTRTLMRIHSRYDLNGQRIYEHSEVDTYLQNYGKTYRLPNPAQKQK
ncbi:hypothetical protein [Brevibacillus massiliensis]|jgi:hypothetical protein|uniref:hypothetical protein n=1 Tax=Brevibacillus massiliensis TaxID=1118054 RepID=UPI0002D4A7B6|nr:hypothetical protein [Brevibacillus massiliensis]